MNDFELIAAAVLVALLVLSSRGLGHAIGVSEGLFPYSANRDVGRATAGIGQGLFPNAIELLYFLCDCIIFCNGTCAFSGFARIDICYSSRHDDRCLPDGSLASHQCTFKPSVRMTLN